ncbi:MAG TPA: tetratricopeptide repeat protein [Burkholderiales bacterium]|jgi:tetratricopeptide (TPR) repeat protein
MHVQDARWGWCLLGLWLLASVASAATGDRLFAQGVGAFKNGNFESAVSYFQQAWAAGLDQPTLHFNLGASLYKLGRYAEAEEAFRACARDPLWAPLANYNAGLSAYQRGKRAAAADYFERAWRTADSDEVRGLALAMLERVDVAASRRPRGALSVDTGYNDNVTLSADNQTLQTTSEPDYFSEVLASATGRWGQDSQTLLWDASLYDLRYGELSGNNVTSITLGASRPSQIASWHTSVGAQWEYVLRHGQRFQQIGSLQLSGIRDRPNRGDLRLSVQLSTIDALDGDFAFLDGSRQEFEASIGQHVGGGQTRLGFAIERNDRADLATANEFFSFSPLRYRVSFAGSWPVRGYWRLQPSTSYAQSRYADADQRASGLAATREDDERRVTLRATYRLSEFWRLFGDYTYADTRSNFPEFSYSQRIISLGASRPF